jgi:hypothetical protein
MNLVRMSKISAYHTNATARLAQKLGVAGLDPLSTWIGSIHPAQVFSVISSVEGVQVVQRAVLEAGILRRDPALDISAAPSSLPRLLPLPPRLPHGAPMETIR